MNHTRLFFGLFVVFLLAVPACGGSESGSSPDDGGRQQADGLSQAELENGIGPVKSVQLGATIDEALAKQGEGVFGSKCTACHKLEERYVGPPLGTVLSRRTPAYVMNMILNPDEMVKRHPEAKAMLAQFLTPMPNQNMSEDEARAVLEYLRANQEEEQDDTEAEEQDDTEASEGTP